MLPFLQNKLVLPPPLQDFITLMLSIIVEALPFVVLGVLFSVIIQRFVTSDKLLLLLPKHKILRSFALSLLGIFMPACECGNVPVARALMARGLSVSESVTFLLAAPIINPITFLATWAAFSYNHSIAAIRIVSGFVIANIIGLIVSRSKRQEALLTQQFHDHCRLDGPRTYMAMVSMFREEVWTMVRLLTFGALIASAVQSFVPRDMLLSVGTNLPLSILAMIALAFVISLCSSVDAFFALAYAGSFTIGSIMAFLVFGPMIDIKMLSMLRSTYRPRLLVIITALVFALSIISGVVAHYVLT